MPKPPSNNKTRTQPGLGSSSGLPRLDSSEMKRVRDSFRRDDPTPEAAPTAKRIRDSIRRDDPDEPEPIPEATATAKRIRDSIRRDDPEPEPTPEATATSKRIRDSIRRDDDSDLNAALRSERPTAKRTSWEPEAPTGTRRKERSARPPVTVDEVGATAVKIARTTRRESAPKLIASRGIIAKAPIDTRAAFVLSLVDGRNTVDAIVDMSGMLEDEVKAILERLARLGLISLP